MASTRRKIVVGTCLLLTLGAHTMAAVPPEAAIPQAFLLAPVAVRSEPTGPIQAAPPLTDPELLSPEALVREVLAQNPTLTQMTAAWEAASARYPQVTSLEDPMFGATFAPASAGSNNVEFGYRLEVSQKLPFPGKRRLRGEGALAEASAAGRDVDDLRLQLIESVLTAFYDYYLATRGLAVNDEALRLLQDLRQSAETRYRAGQVPQQDILQAEVEMARQREHGVTLERMRRVAVARLNTLMHRQPDTPLATPPERLAVTRTLPAVEILRARAVAQRPDLQALAARVAADQAALGLALRDYYPDVEVTAAYDTIMGNGPMRDLAPQVGFRVNLPVFRARREAAVVEARARTAQRQAELAARTDQVNLQVQEAYEQVTESAQSVRLYETTALPVAAQNVSAARSAYQTGKTPFVSLIEAERTLVQLRDRSFEVTADYFRRLATLERVSGGPLWPALDAPSPLPGGASPAGTMHRQ